MNYVRAIPLSFTHLTYEWAPFLPPFLVVFFSFFREIPILEFSDRGILLHQFTREVKGPKCATHKKIEEGHDYVKRNG